MLSHGRRRRRGFGLIDEKQRRLRSAQRRLGAARLLLDEDFVPDAINRMYYGVAEASRALLIEKGVDPGTHAGMINQLGLHYRDVLDVITVTQLRQDRDQQPDAVRTERGLHGLPTHARGR